MRSNDIERERGITILAKNTAINYKDYKINNRCSGPCRFWRRSWKRILKWLLELLLVNEYLKELCYRQDLYFKGTGFKQIGCVSALIRLMNYGEN